MNIHGSTAKLAGLSWEKLHRDDGQYIFIRDEWMISFDELNWLIHKNDTYHWMGNNREYSLDDVAKIAKELIFLTEQAAVKHSPNKPQNVSVGVYSDGDTIQVWCARFALRGSFTDPKAIERHITDVLKKVDFGLFKKD